MKILIVFHSLYWHVATLAEAVASWAKSVDWAEVSIKQVEETLSPEVIEKMWATQAKKNLEKYSIATSDDLANADAIIFGTPTRFGMMSAQMRTFMDKTWWLWMKWSLIWKVWSVFTSSWTQHWWQESTILSFHTTLLHQWMIIAGLPYSAKWQMTMDEISWWSPYWASTIAWWDWSRMPSQNELELAKAQWKYVAEIAKKLSRN